MEARATLIRLLMVLALSGFAAAGHAREPEEIISEGEARRIAWSAGLVHVEEITRAADRWEIAGRSADDTEMLIDIDIRNGRILD